MSWRSYLAKKYLRAPTKRGLRVVLVLAVLGVTLGVATLMLTQAVLQGFERVFLESILGFNAHLVVLKDGEMSQPEVELAKLSALLGSELRAATPFLYREVLLVAHGRVKGAVFKGIDPLTFPRVYAVKARLAGEPQVPAKIEELLQGPSEIPKVVLGEDLAEALGVHQAGETVKVFLPQKASKLQAESNFKSFRVVGLFSSGLYEYDHGFAFVNAKALQNLLGVESAATGFEMILAHPARADKIAERLKFELGFGYKAVSWKRLNATLFTALRQERAVFLVIMAMVVAVAAFNIVGVLLLRILEKRREISVLRAMGAPISGLKRVFEYQGLVIASVGSLLGIGLGLGLAEFLQYSGILKLEKEVYLVERLPVEISPLVVVMVAAVSMAICTAASWLALRSLKRAPLDL
ncbi:MAG TPA: hypothetical protein DF383_07215 [Deltaproteobacteria bacterium]|nr:hypothetical protein [Deltaproteobacteria bacterium]